MMDKLLPCPFCGGEAKITDGGFSGEQFLVCCRELLCPAASGTVRKTQKQAIAAWNRRCGKDINVATNADRIRSLSDEELATEITKNPSIPCRMCEYYNHKLGYCGARRDFVCVTAYAEALALDWLQQPAKEEHHEKRT